MSLPRRWARPASVLLARGFPLAVTAPGLTGTARRAALRCPLCPRLSGLAGLRASVRGTEPRSGHSARHSRGVLLSHICSHAIGQSAWPSPASREGHALTRSRAPQGHTAERGGEGAETGAQCRSRHGCGRPVRGRSVAGPGQRGAARAVFSGHTCALDRFPPVAGRLGCSHRREGLTGGPCPTPCTRRSRGLRELALA